MSATGTQIAAQARTLGYTVVRVEQLRANRWLLTLRCPEDHAILVLAQRRPLLIAADVYDLAEAMRLNRSAIGYVLALEGRFSPEAFRAAHDLRSLHIHLATDLPPARRPAPTGNFETA